MLTAIAVLTNCSGQLLLPELQIMQSLSRWQKFGAVVNDRRTGAMIQASVSFDPIKGELTSCPLDKRECGGEDLEKKNWQKLKSKEKARRDMINSFTKLYDIGCIAMFDSLSEDEKERMQKLLIGIQGYIIP